MTFRALAVASAAFSLIALSGCIISVNETCDHVHAEDCVGPVGNYAGAIRAASTITYSSERCDTLRTIAGKPDIDEPSQLMLINHLANSGGHSSEKTSVLNVLITNPALTPQASLAVANKLERISTYSSDRKTIADLLAQRSLPPAPTNSIPASPPPQTAPAAPK